MNNKLAEVKHLLKNKHGRIMIVDNDEFCLQSLKIYLQELKVDVNNKVDFCIDGSEAVETI